MRVDLRDRLICTGEYSLLFAEAGGGGGGGQRLIFYLIQNICTCTRVDHNCHWSVMNDDFEQRLGLLFTSAIDIKCLSNII